MIARRLTNVLGPVLAGVAVAVAGWLYVCYGSGNLARIASHDMHWHVDFDSFWRSALALRDGGDLYRTGAELPNLNPPLLAVLLAPLAELDPLPAYRAFALLNVVLVTGSVIAVARAARTSTGWAMVAIAAVLASSPLHGTLALGQIYGLLTAGLTLAWLAERTGRGVLAGVALGLVIAMKPSLLPLLAWPAVCRAWPTLVAALAAGVTGTGVGVLVGGWQATLDWLAALRAISPDGFLDNDSLAALAVRFGLPAWPGYLVAGGLLVVTLYRARRRPEHALWALTAGSLLFAPIAWNNYLVLLAPAVPLLLARDRVAAALPLMALPLIGIEWSIPLVGADLNSLSARLAMSLYFGMLLAYWSAMTFGPVERDVGVADDRSTGPVTVTTCHCESRPSLDRSSVESSPSR